MSKTKTTRVIPLLALRGILVFPDMIMHLDVGREKSVAALERAMVDDNEILLVSQRQANLDDPQPEDLFSVGTVASIKQVLKLPGGTVRVLVEGLARARVVRYLELEPLFLAEAELLAEDEADTPEHEAYMRALLHQFERYIKLSKKIPPDTLISISEIDEPGRLADLITGHLSLKVEQKQQILEAADSLRRLELLTEILARENEMLEVERRLGARVRKQMEKNQREYYLREQLKAIQKELGEGTAFRRKPMPSVRPWLPSSFPTKCGKRLPRKLTAWSARPRPAPKTSCCAITWSGPSPCPGARKAGTAWI